MLVSTCTCLGVSVVNSDDSIAFDCAMPIAYCNVVGSRNVACSMAAVMRQFPADRVHNVLHHFCASDSANLRR